MYEDGCGQSLHSHLNANAVRLLSRWARGAWQAFLHRGQVGKRLRLGGSTVFRKLRRRVNLCRRSLSHGAGSRLILPPMWVGGPVSGSNGPAQSSYLRWLGASVHYISLDPPFTHVVGPTSYIVRLLTHRCENWVFWPRFLQLEKSCRPDVHQLSTLGVLPIIHPDKLREGSDNWHLIPDHQT